jgi:two-component system sensor histidine kinase MprB
VRFRGSLAARVSLLVTVAVGLSVALVATAAYMTVRHQLIASLDHSLLERASGASQSGAVLFVIQHHYPSELLGAADVRLALLDANGVVQNSPAGADEPPFLPGGPELEVARGQEAWSIRTITTGRGAYRVAAVPGAEADTALILAQSLAPTYEALSKLGFVLALFGLLGVVVAGFAGWAVARNGLSPVRRLTDAVEEIARTEKLDPIMVEGNDEIARLAVAFNSMLAALAASRDRQRQLVADAGHELRTPLTSLRTNLELLGQAQSRGGLSEELRAELMDDIRFQIEELTTLIGDLTELARDEPILAQVEPVDFAEVVERAVQRVRRRATSLTFDVGLESWLVTGESASLERAVINLLDNAAKWSPPLGVVTIRLERGTLYVADEGPGIAPEDLPHVFERFYRSKESRTLPGSGLGLSIVRQIAERHGGAVRAGASPEGGAAFWMWLPASASRAQDVLTEDLGTAKPPLSVGSGETDTLET